MLLDARLAENAELLALRQSYQELKEQVKQAKVEKSVAKTAYQKAVQSGEKDGLKMLELLTQYRKSKHMLHYHALNSDLAKYKLYQWLDSWSRETAVPQSSKDKKEKKQKISVSNEKTKKLPGASSVPPVEPKKNGEKS